MLLDLNEHSLNTVLTSLLIAACHLFLLLKGVWIHHCLFERPISLSQQIGIIGVSVSHMRVLLGFLFEEFATAGDQTWERFLASVHTVMVVESVLRLAMPAACRA